MAARATDLACWSIATAVACSVPSACSYISRSPFPARDATYRWLARRHPAYIPGARGRQVGALLFGFGTLRCGAYRLHRFGQTSSSTRTIERNGLPRAQRLPARPPRTRCVYPSDKRPRPHASIRRRRERPGLRCPVALSQIAPNRDGGHACPPLPRNRLIPAASQIHPPRKPLRPGRETPSQSERPSWRRYSGYGSEPSPRSRQATRQSPRPTPALPEA